MAMQGRQIPSTVPHEIGVDRSLLFPQRFRNRVARFLPSARCVDAPEHGTFLLVRCGRPKWEERCYLIRASSLRHARALLGLPGLARKATMQTTTDLCACYHDSGSTTASVHNIAGDVEISAVQYDAAALGGRTMGRAEQYILGKRLSLSLELQQWWCGALEGSMGIPQHASVWGKVLHTVKTNG